MRALLGWAASLGALLASTALAAEPATSEARACGTGSAPLDIIWHDVEAPDALESAVCDWFRDEPWRVRFARAVIPASSDPTMADRGPSSPPALRIDVQLEPTALARLSVLASGERSWVYEVPLPGPLDAAGVEVIAQSLHSVAQAAAERTAASRQPRRPAGTGATTTLEGHTATARATARQAASPARNTSIEADGTRSARSTRPAGRRGATTARHHSGPSLPVHTGLGYLGFVRGDEPLLHGPTLRIMLDAWRELPRLGAFFRGTLFTSSEQRRAGVALRSSGVSLGAGASLAAPIISALPALEAHAALGGGVDLIAIDATVLDPTELRLAPDRRTRPRPFLEADAGLAWRRGPIELELSFLLRWQLLHTTYQVSDAERQRATIIEPWRLQPGAALTLAYVW